LGLGVVEVARRCAPSQVTILIDLENVEFGYHVRYLLTSAATAFQQVGRLFCGIALDDAGSRPLVWTVAKRRVFRHAQ
jgi:hypothetical protein